MTIEALPFEHRPRNSIANNLDKINELVDWVNLDTHLYASATGERVTVDDASTVKGLTVDGRSVQDGTPTPDAPVAVQVVQGGNLQSWPTSGNYSSGGASITRGTNGDTITVASGTTSNVWALPGSERPNYLVHLMPGTYVVTCPGNLRLMVLSYDDGTWTNIASNTRSPYILTLLEASDIICMYSILNGTAAGTYEGWVQLEAGSTATPYTPYGSIGIVIDDAATSINLQGNKLASLPDGTRDELRVDSTGRVCIDKRVGHTTQAVTDGVTGTVGTDVLSSTGQIADGADVWYKLATTQAIDLGYIDPPAIPSGSVVTISASLTPTIHLDWWVDDGITALVDDLIAYIDYKTEG